jgi:1-acyl-sn-glycerol-3-phosphate acyltransferase
LRVWRVELVVHRDHPVPPGQVVYIANHTSTLDILILLALRLHDSRFFLAGKYRRMPLLGFPAWMCGTFFTVPQDRPQERVKIFQRADRKLRATGESVFLVPEGTRVLGGQIGHFNKGAFHLATSLRAPIVPLFIGIPQEINPGKGFDMRAGRVHVWFEPAIDTSAWTPEELEQNRDRVRALYVRLNQERRASCPSRQ